MKKLILFSPSQKNIYSQAPPYPPLGLLSIASVLKENKFEVELIEEDFHDKKDILLKLSEKNILAIFATATTPLFDRIEKLAAQLQQIKGPPLIIGGPHVWSVGKAAIKNGILAGVSGEGEITTVRLAEKLLNNEDFSDIEGIITDKFENSLPPPITDLDSLPFPDYSLARPWKRYRPPEARVYPAIPVNLSRGCPGKCIFCSTPGFWGNNIRRMSPERSMELVEYLVKEEKAKEIHIADDDLTGDREWIEIFLSLIRKSNLKVSFVFLNGLRASNLDEDMLTQLKYSNFLNVGFGIESGNKNIYRKIGKGISFKKMNEAIELSKKHGFNVWAFYIFGLPGETIHTIDESINHSLKSKIDFAKYFILQPYPGTPIHKMYKKKNYLDEDIKSSLYGNASFTLPDITSFELEKMRRKAYLKFYTNPKKIFNILNKFFKYNTLSFISSSSFVLKMMKK